MKITSSILFTLFSVILLSAVSVSAYVFDNLGQGWKNASTVSTSGSLAQEFTTGTENIISQVTLGLYINTGATGHVNMNIYAGVSWDSGSDTYTFINPVPGGSWQLDASIMGTSDTNYSHTFIQFASPLTLTPSHKYYLEVTSTDASGTINWATSVVQDNNNGAWESVYPVEGNYPFKMRVSAIPEPSTYLLLTGSLLVVGLVRKKIKS